MTIQSTKAIRFILHCNLWGTIPIFLHFISWYCGLHPYIENVGQAEATTHLTFCIELAAPLAVWAWLAQHGLTELNKLREQAAKDRNDNSGENPVSAHENAEIQKSGWGGKVERNWNKLW
jgi:hypothetical protein